MKQAATLAVLGAVLMASAHAAGPGHHSHDHAEAAEEAHHSHHNRVEVPEGGSVQPPHVEIEVLKDPMSGWNLRVRTTHFRFAPERVSGENRMGEGHGHLYINGEKITRVYGPWHHLGALTPGKHEIRIGLSANDHSAYTYKGQPIRDTVVVHIEE